LYNFVPKQFPILVCCQTLYLYTIEFWGACDVYMKLDLVCGVDLKVLQIEKMCKIQGHKVQKNYLKNWAQTHNKWT